MKVGLTGAAFFIARKGQQQIAQSFPAFPALHCEASASHVVRGWLPFLKVGLYVGLAQLLGAAVYRAYVEKTNDLLIGCSIPGHL